MSVVGIIAEFNPFHRGHEYIIREAKRITGAEHCVVVMSGDFVQRGEPAVCDKYLRTKMALAGGADAVFELPVPYATGSAEIFAEAGIKLLTSLGCVNYVAFGCECKDIDPLMSCAEILAEEPGIYKETLKNELKKGLSFPAAREVALGAALNAQAKTDSGTGRTQPADNVISDILKSPNNILAVEYCKAILKLWKLHGDTLHVPSPVAIRRVGSDYNDSVLSDSGFSSAAAIRAGMSDTLEARTQCSKPGLSDTQLSSDILQNLPGYTATLLNSELGRTLPVTADALSDMLHIRLATVTDTDLDLISDVGSDFANTLRKYTSPVPTLTFTEMCRKLKSKNITYSAVSRALLHVTLGITKDYIGLLKENTYLPYARLLGFKTESSKLLRAVSDNQDCVLITKLGDAREALADNPDALKLLGADLRATAVYGQLIRSRFGTPVVDEFVTGIVRE